MPKMVPFHYTIAEFHNLDIYKELRNNFYILSNRFPYLSYSLKLYSIVWHSYQHDVMIWKTFPLYWLFMIGVFFHKGLVIQSFDILSITGTNSWMTSCRWFKAPWRSFDAAVIEDQDPKDQANFRDYVPFQTLHRPILLTRFLSEFKFDEKYIVFFN